MCMKRVYWCIFQYLRFMVTNVGMISNPCCENGIPEMSARSQLSLSVIQLAKCWHQPCTIFPTRITNLSLAPPSPYILNYNKHNIHLHFMQVSWLGLCQDFELNFISLVNQMLTHTHTHRIHLWIHFCWFSQKNKNLLRALGKFCSALDKESAGHEATRSYVWQQRSTDIPCLQPIGELYIREPSP